jgi:Transposase
MPRKPSTSTSERRGGRTGQKLGRPTSYRPSFVKKVREWCERGATNAVVAERLGVSPSVLRGWKRQHTEFRDAFSRVVEGQTKGRSTSYRAAYIKRAFELCLLGAGDEKIAEHLGTSYRNLKIWKNQYPAFGEAFVRGREGADAAVAGALYMKSKGFERKSEKIHVLKDGTIVRVPYTEYYPPDTAAQAFYLSNRQREWWRKDPETTFNVNMSLEQLVLDAIEYRKESAGKAAKVIEHQPAAEPLPEEGQAHD